MGVDFDVVVVGAGGAGLAAALSAAEQGASVIVIEAATEIGGSTALSGGSFMAAGTDIQAELGHPDDTADAFYDHYLTFNRWDVEPAIARRFCDEALPTFHWLQRLGVEYPPGGLYRATREAAPRTHRPTGGGASYIAALARALRLAGGEIALDTRVDELVIGVDGAVEGIRASGEDLRAHSVVLATGGFGADSDMLRKLVPDAAGPDLGPDEPVPVWSPAVPTCRGDGIALAASAAAAIVGTGAGDLLLSSGLVRDVEPYPPGWLMMVGRDGRRFVDESAPYAVVTPLALRHGPCWVILDDRLLRSAKGTSGPWGAGSWTADVLVPALESGRITSAATVDELARVIGVPEAALAADLERYNDACRQGHDPAFLKDPASLVSVQEAPFHAVRLWPSVVAVTSTGPRIDPDAQVLREVDAEPVSGLFAAGEVTGNVIGAQYLGGGNAIGSALIFGRIAGRSAAERARTKVG